MRVRATRRVMAALVGGVCAAALLTVPASADSRPSYLDAKAPVSKRVADLLRRMTVEEKVGQLQQIAVSRLQGECTWGGGELTERCMREVLVDDKVGSILSGGGMGPVTNTPRAWAEMTNAVQRYAIENSRLHIPIVYGVDAVHGHNNVLGATVFPHQIGLGATWDAPLVRSAAASTRRSIAATGSPWNFAPVAEVARDQRWGRYYETFAEDPLLAGSLAAASVKGYQDAPGVAATVKHFAGYSVPTNGHDRVPADMSARYLQDTILPPYKAAVDAGALTLMVNSGAVNGVPATASRYLLTDVLRKQWKFDGLVVSDWNDVLSLQTAYKIAPDYPVAVALAVNAGVDMAMLPPDDRTFHASTLEAVRRGLISQRRLNEAAGRVLQFKFRLGLFERPYVDPSRADAAVLRADAGLARRTAADSMVLLRNEGSALPLRAGSRVVVTGPSADSMPNQVGGWTIGWQGVPDGVTVPGTTIVQGLTSSAPAGTAIVHAPVPADAVAQTRDADAAVVVVGEKPGSEGPADTPRPELAADQVALVKALQATGKPVIVVVVSGRPLVLHEAGATAGLVAAWLPGNEGGLAVADVLYGRVNPSGRLPVSWPKSLGHDPVHYMQLPGTNGGPDSGYSPLFPFGAGLSYTTYSVDGVTVDVRRGTVRASVRVANTGDRAGSLVVPLYVGQPVASVLAPPKRLAAYTKVSLKPGEAKTVQLDFPVSRLAVTPGDIDGHGRPQTAAGVYQVFAGTHQADFTIR